jgi:DNA repair exonuclease SbcCD ATPase subunit
MTGVQEMSDSNTTTTMSAADDIEKLRRELTTEREARKAAEAKSEFYTQQQRNAIDSMRPEVTDYITSLTEKFPDYASDLAPMTPWAASCHQGVEPSNELPVVRTLQCASVIQKNTEKKVSDLEAKLRTFDSAMCELEETQKKRQKLETQNVELQAECSSMRENLKRLEEQLSASRGFEAGNNRLQDAAHVPTTSEAVISVNAGSKKPVGGGKAPPSFEQKKIEFTNPLLKSLMNQVQTTSTNLGRFVPNMHSNHSLLSPSTSSPF